MQQLSKTLQDLVITSIMYTLLNTLVTTKMMQICLSKIPTPKMSMIMRVMKQISVTGNFALHHDHVGTGLLQANVFILR